MPVSGVKPISQLKCIHTIAHSMGNKQEELQTTMQWERQEAVTITEMCGMTHMAGVLQWMVISSLEGTGKQGEAVGWLCVLGNVWTVQNSRMVMTRLSAYGYGSGERITRCTSEWESVRKSQSG